MSISYSGATKQIPVLFTAKCDHRARSKELWDLTVHGGSGRNAFFGPLISTCIKGGCGNVKLQSIMIYAMSVFKDHFLETKSTFDVLDAGPSIHIANMVISMELVKDFMKNHGSMLKHVMWCLFTLRSLRYAKPSFSLKFTSLCTVEHP